MIPWVPFTILIITHVFMFALGVISFQVLRWVNARPIYARNQGLSEQKIQEMATKMAQRQVVEQYNWMTRFQGNGVTEEGVQSVTPPKQR